MRILSILLIVFAWFAPATQAQLLNPVTWSFEASPVPVRPGEVLTVELVGAIDEGWNVYALDTPKGTGKPLSVAFGEELPPGFVLAGAPEQDEPLQKYDPNFRKESRFFAERAVVRVPIRVEENVAPGPYDVAGTLQFMVCNDRQCLPPKRIPAVVRVTVEAGAARSRFVPPSPSSAPMSTDAPPVGADAEPEIDRASGAAAPTLEPEAGTDRLVEDAAPAEGGGAFPRTGGNRAGGLLPFLLLAVGAGLAALLTPCVFPMIPLTVSYFTHHAHDRGQAVRMAGVYGLAIVVTFTLLGVLTAVFVGAAGAQTIAANPWVNLFIGSVFVLFALSLLGLFELRVPQSVLNFFNRQSNENQGYTGVLFMGLTLTLVSFSCTVPFVAALLAAAAQSEWVRPILGMLAFSSTFALPFVVFALFPRALSSLPKSGAWMNTVKVVLGFVELAAALKFLSNADLVWGTGLLSRPLALSLAIVIFFCCGLYLLGKLRLAHEEPTGSIGALRLVVGIGALGLSLYMIPGLLGAPLGALDAYLPPRLSSDFSLAAAGSNGSAGRAEEFAWFEEVEAALVEAQASGKPVFVDFTGYTCTNCRYMEANIFPKAGIAQRLEEDFVLLRLWTDDNEAGPDHQRYQLRLTGTNALPTYAILTPDGDLVTQWGGVASATEFAAFLGDGLAAFENEPVASL